MHALEQAHPAGLKVQEIVDAFGSKGDRLTEATFRKYVQLGLLPRSVRVGSKGKHRGSMGLYPATVIRRIDTIRRLMGQGYTIEEIQTEFFFIRGDIEELSRSLTRVYGAIERALSRRSSAVRRGGDRDGRMSDVASGTDELATKKYVEAKRLGQELLKALDEIEQRASLQARLKRAQV
ncbi:MAG: MerR family transcriptional regulator [Deltaproteobacteria bacterium]|nr:MerR family transcriptional regulator [Deltaproteobacteria bacterium]